MKISIGRLKEIIMEEVAKATIKEEEDLMEFGSPEFQAALKKRKQERAQAKIPPRPAPEKTSAQRGAEEAEKCQQAQSEYEYRECMARLGLKEESEPLDEGLADAVASPFITLLNALLPQITPERREAMLKDFEEEVKREAAASSRRSRDAPPADKYGGDYDITGIAPQDYELYAESLNIEIVDDE